MKALATTALILGLVPICLCEDTNFAVTAITRTVEDSVSLHWRSETNAVYRIQFASELATNTTWETLYDNYPSHGATTFWTDQGDWVTNPEVLHPSKAKSGFTAS